MVGLLLWQKLIVLNLSGQERKDGRYFLGYIIRRTGQYRDVSLTQQCLYHRLYNTYSCVAFLFFVINPPLSLLYYLSI